MGSSKKSYFLCMKFFKGHSFQFEFFNVSFKVIVHSTGCTNYNGHNHHIRQSSQCLDFDRKICVRSNFVEPFSTDVIVVWYGYVDYAGHVCSFVDDIMSGLLCWIVWSFWTEKFQRILTLLFSSIVRG